MLHHMFWYELFSSNVYSHTMLTIQNNVMFQKLTTGNNVGRCLTIQHGYNIATPLINISKHLYNDKTLIIISIPIFPNNQYQLQCLHWAAFRPMYSVSQKNDSIENYFIEPNLETVQHCFWNLLYSGSCLMYLFGTD